MSETAQQTVRSGKHGFREALCPACGQWVDVTSRPDDTRWRYGRHAEPGCGLACIASGELVIVDPPTLTPPAS